MPDRWRDYQIARTIVNNLGDDTAGNAGDESGSAGVAMFLRYRDRISSTISVRWICAVAAVRGMVSRSSSRRGAL